MTFAQPADAGKLPPMLTDDELSLITAAMDGELSEREAQSLRQLLQSSTEARIVFARLKADSTRLRKLPRLTPPADLQTRVLAKLATVTPPHIAIPTRRAEPAPLQSPPRHTKGRRWVPIAMAASLLVGVTASSFWFFTRNNTNTAQDSNRLAPRTNPADSAWVKVLPADGARPTAPMPAESNGGVAHNTERRPPVKPVEPHAVAIAPKPRPLTSDALGSPLGPDIRFDLVQVRVPFLKTLSDFDREDVRHELTQELGRDPAFRIDLFARDTVRGVEWFQKAARAAKLTVHADATTMNLLAKRPSGHMIAIYTEALTAAEVTGLFAKLNAEDAKISPRLFDMLHATPVVKADETELRTVLGTDVGLFKRTTPERNDKPADGKSVSAGTADQIVKAIAAKGGERAAVLMTWSPSGGRTPPTNSAELKAYLAKRGERKPNAVPVLIVIRHGNG